MAKKKKKPHHDPPPFDRRLMDRHMASIHKALEGKEFSSPEEADEYLNSLIQEHGGKLPEPESETPREMALELVYEALVSKGKRREKLAKDALQIDPDCTDAYILLAEETATTPEEAVFLFRKALLTAERTLGPEYFTDPEYIGHFWGILETRPYMRAGAGLGGALWEIGETEEAIALYQKLLHLNPDDNQALRHLLVVWLVTAGRDKEAEELLKQYPGEDMAIMHYTRALLAFRRHGDSARSRKALEKAYIRNRWVPVYMLGVLEMEDMPELYAPYSEEEGALAAMGSMEVWVETPDAMPWFTAEICKMALLTTAEIDEDDFSFDFE